VLKIIFRNPTLLICTGKYDCMARVSTIAWHGLLRLLYTVFSELVECCGHFFAVFFPKPYKPGLLSCGVFSLFPAALAEHTSGGDKGQHGNPLAFTSDNCVPVEPCLYGSPISWDLHWRVFNSF